jgi:hypothetical protein
MTSVKARPLLPPSAGKGSLTLPLRLVTTMSPSDERRNVATAEKTPTDGSEAASRSIAAGLLFVAAATEPTDDIEDSI